MIDFNEINVEETLKMMQEKQEQLMSIGKEVEKRTEEQATLFLENCRKVLPLLEFLREQSYMFSNPNPNIRYRSARGPLLAFNSKDRKVYVYSIENKRIEGIGLDDEKITFVHPKDFFEKYSFDDAMAGLQEALNVQELHEDYLTKNLAERESLLGKYL